MQMNHVYIVRRCASVGGGPEIYTGYSWRNQPKINFSTTLVPYTSKTSWIDKKVSEMKSLLESDQIPEINKSCEQCAYLTGGKEF